MTEPSGGSYARQATTFTVSGTSPTMAVNTAAVVWPIATASWGTITHVCLYDALSGGNLLFWLRLVDSSDYATPVSQTVIAGDQFTVDASALRLRCD